MVRPKTLAQFLIPLCIGMFTAVTPVAEAASYYVATTGSDSSPGTVIQPFRTIAKGLSSLRAGDILYLRAGTYNETINSNSQKIPTGTSWDNAPIISGYPGETATLAVGNSSELVNLPHSYVQFLSFENLVLDGLNTTGLVISLGSSGAHHIRFKNCEIKNAAHHLVFLQGHHHIITGSHIHHTGNTTLYPRPTSKHYAFYVQGTDNLIEDSEIHHTNDFAIHNYSGSGVLADRNIYRNLVLHDTGLLCASCSAITINNGNDVMAYNNVLYKNTGHGIIVGSGGSNARIYNNTVYGGLQTGIYIQPGSSGAIVQNNIAYANATIQILNEGGATVSYNFVTDPSFMNVASLDFNLRSSSPAIDAGIVVSQVTTDIRKRNRPQGPTHDIGAYEIGSSSAPAPPKNLSVR
jgi:hypothetical protein